MTISVISASKSHRQFSINDEYFVGVHFQRDFRTCTVTFSNQDRSVEQSHFFYTADFPTGDWSEGRKKAFRWMRLVDLDKVIDKQYNELESQKQKIERQIAALQRQLEDLTERQEELFDSVKVPDEAQESDVVFDDAPGFIRNDEGYDLTQTILDFAKDKTKAVSKSLGKVEVLISKPIMDGSVPIATNYCAYVKGDRGQWIAVRALSDTYIQWLFQKLVPTNYDPRRSISTSYGGYPEYVKAELTPDGVNPRVILSFK